jgi:hypothetical protein
MFATMMLKSRLLDWTPALSYVRTRTRTREGEGEGEREREGGSHFLSFSSLRQLDFEIERQDWED